jgi:hypothetical protein
VATAEADTTEITDPQRRFRVRVASAAVAIVLVIVAGVLVTHHQSQTRSAANFCSDMSASKDLTHTLASGNADQITTAVHQFDRAAKVAPVAIEPQVRVLTTYADGLTASLARGGDPNQALADAVRRQESQIPAVEVAGRALEQYVQTTCGFTLGSASPPTTGG